MNGKNITKLPSQLDQDLDWLFNSEAVSLEI